MQYGNPVAAQQQITKLNVQLPAVEHEDPSWEA